MTDRSKTSGNEVIEVGMTRPEWDVVTHALEEEMAQIQPPEENWIGKYPGEDEAVAIDDVFEKIQTEVANEQ